jgi:hypothetical protein
VLEPVRVLAIQDGGQYWIILTVVDQVSRFFLVDDAGLDWLLSGGRTRGDRDTGPARVMMTFSFERLGLVDVGLAFEGTWLFV